MYRFANETSGEPFVPPIIRAILLHFALAYDHPFVDGNGRIARALFYWSALSGGYTEMDDRDVTYFIVHQLATVIRAIDEFHAYLRRKAEERHEIESLLHASEQWQAALNHRQLALIRHALRHPGTGYTIEGQRRSHNVVYQTALTDLLALGELGMLVKQKMGRSFVFLAPESLRD